MQDFSEKKCGCPLKFLNQKQFPAKSRAKIFRIAKEKGRDGGKEIEY